MEIVTASMVTKTLSEQIYRFIYNYFPFFTAEFYFRLVGYYDRIPYEWKIKELLLVGVSFIVFSYIFFKKKICWNEFIRYWILISYTFLVLISTVFSREKLMKRYVVYLPFSSYLEWIQNGNMDVFWEDLYNIIMFIPVGILVCGKCNMKTSCLIGMLFSILIEGLQFVLYKGTCELDDIINNVIGVIVGYVGRCLLEKTGNAIIDYVKYRRKRK